MLLIDVFIFPNLNISIVILQSQACIFVAEHITMMEIVQNYADVVMHGLFVNKFKT